MEYLAKHTIAGAEFDSSARFPPPLCHPGTRVDISDRIHKWMHNDKVKERLLWLYGPAGVGKSAIIQTLAESECESTVLLLAATLFFSRTGRRDDPQRIFLTIAYQLAVQHQPYRNYITNLLATDPKLVDKSMTEQFKRLILKPFIEERLLEGLDRTILMLIDGLDECMGEWAQREIVLLIGKFTIQYPEAPVIWVIASRPEPHIRVAFTSLSVEPGYVEVELSINSTQARLDVEQYLRDEFSLIRQRYPACFPSKLKEWPTKAQLLKIAGRASGLFVFASTVVRFIDDLVYGNPISRLQKVLDVIDTTSLPEIVESPFGVLDILYTEIMSAVPPQLLSLAKRILAFVLPVMSSLPPFVVVCNWLGLTQADAYGALQRLYAVLNVPLPEAEHQELRVFHTSFVDFLISRPRSGPFWMDDLEARREIFQSSLRVLRESHNAGARAIHPSQIRLSWPMEDRGKHVREDVFWSSLYQVLIAKEEVLDETTWDMFRNSASFFDDLDIGIIESTFMIPATWDLLDAYHQSPFLSYLMDRSVLQTVPMRALDMDCINLDRMHIVCVTKNLCEVELEARLPRPSNRKLAEVMDLLNDFWRYWTLTKDAVYSTIFPAWRHPGWKAYVQNCLVAAARSTPTRCAVMYGKTEKRWVLTQLEFTSDHWLCLAPYEQ